MIYDKSVSEKTHFFRTLGIHVRYIFRVSVSLFPPPPWARVILALNCDLKKAL